MLEPLVLQHRKRVPGRMLAEDCRPERSGVVRPILAEEPEVALLTPLRLTRIQRTNLAGASGSSPNRALAMWTRKRLYTALPDTEQQKTAPRRVRSVKP